MIMNFPEIIEQRYPNIELLLVAEAGSRAWGFASEDSDYDIRFVYKHRDRKRYLELEEPAQVISFTTDDGLYDYAGWDIKKTCRLAAKSNFSLHEWLASPIIYDRSLLFYEIMKEYAKYNYCAVACCNHYRGMAHHTFKEHVAGSGETTLKKFFYIIRPLLCIEYIFTYGRMPPVLFRELLDNSAEIEGECKQKLYHLLYLKMNHPEITKAPADLDIYFTEWIVRMLDKWSHNKIKETFQYKEPKLALLNQLFQEYVG